MGIIQIPSEFLNPAPLGTAVAILQQDHREMLYDSVPSRPLFLLSMASLGVAP